MSVIQTVVIIGLVVLILAFVISMFVLNRVFTKKITNLTEDLNLFDDVQVRQQSQKLADMALSGESLSSFQNWYTIYANIKQTRVPEIEQELSQATEANAKYSIWSAQKLIHQAEKQLQDVTTDFHDARAVFRQLLQSNHDNAAQLAALLKTYQELRKNVLSHSFRYGYAMDKLENHLVDVESDFDIVRNLSKQGDHVEAKRVLSRINMTLTNLENKLPKIDQGYELLHDKFPPQLDDITTGYKKMSAEKYQFSAINIPVKIKEINGLLDKSKYALENLDVDGLAATNERIQKEIDNLYDVLEQEIKAKKYVDKKRDYMVNYFTHAGQQSNELIRQLDHIDQSYQLTHGELDEANALSSEINQMQNDYEIDMQKAADGRAVYSEIRNDFLHMDDRLHAIEKRQKQISHDVNGLFDAEKVAQTSVSEFEQEVSLLKRRLDRQRLPGIPEDYIDFYQVVIKEIAEVNEALNQVRIDLEMISKKLILLQEDINRLSRATDEIIDSASLVGRLAQYVNKFHDNEIIDAAMATAMAQYQSEFAYKDALDTLATALEKVEPGAFARIEDEYAQDKHN